MTQVGGEADLFTRCSAPPAVVHFYSYATGVSFELPVGFALEHEGDSHALYAREADQVLVSEVGPVGSMDPEARIRAFVEGETGASAVISRRARMVDDLPVLTVVTREGGGWTHRTALAADGRLISITGTCPSAGTKDALAWLDDAVESVRVIAL